MPAVFHERPWSLRRGGASPARFHPKDARKGFRPAGQNPSGTGTGVEDPLICHGICRDTFPLWGEGFSGGWKPPLRGPLQSLRRGAHCAPAVFHERPWSLRRDGSCPCPFSSEGCPKGVAPHRTEPLWDRDGGRKTPHPSRRYAVTPSPLWGEGFSGGWKPPLRGPLRSLRRGAQSAPAVSHRPFHRAHRPPVENFLGSEESPEKPCGFPGPCF